MAKLHTFIFLLITTFCLGQQTVVSGRVIEKNSGEGMPEVKVQFQNSKIGTFTDSLGYYSLSTYYATDSLTFFMPEFVLQVKAVKKDVSQTINVTLSESILDITEVVIRPPDEFPSTILHKKVIANKPINDREKLEAYDYDIYNKFQIDLNNMGEKFKERSIVKRLDLIMNYMDSIENKEPVLPLLLSESLSRYSYRKTPKQKKEVVSATRITGIDNLELSQFLGDLYFDVNIYDNYINLFKKAFISPVANFARSYYKFYLEDSMYIDNNWCYKLRFIPKRSGDMVFEGEMWIHDTTYAVKSFKANLSNNANINFLNDLYMEYHFKQVEKEVWMQTSEKMIMDINITKGSKLYGFYGRKQSYRSNFTINPLHPDEYYKSTYTVEIQDSAKLRSKEYWDAHRPIPLNTQESNIEVMIDSLNQNKYFRFWKNTIYMIATGYYPIKKVELGSIFSLFAFNPVEKFRTGLSLRTSNKFSRRIELGGQVYYGFGDKQFKYGSSIRINITPKKRGILMLYGKHDIEQLGATPKAAAVGSTFGTIFRTGPLDKLTFVDKVGINLEKDFGKDFVVFGGLEWKEYTPLGLANYEKINALGGIDTIRHIQSSEATLRIRWCKNEEYISGSFDRKTISSRFPILSLQGIFGMKGVLGSDYMYQKIEFALEHAINIGVMGRLKYGVDAGVIFGKAAYPFLKVHEGSQSYWLQTNAFNKMNYFEFISDRYVGAFFEHHWNGLFFDRIPLIKKLKWRLVTGGRMTFGALDPRHTDAMLIPSFVKSFGDTPYVEFSVGIENIFKVGRIDLVWRASHLDKGMNPLGIRGRFSFSF